MVAVATARLTAGMRADRALTLREHAALHGPLPERGAELIEMVARSGLRGRGGADFPTGTKLRAVAERRGARIVVANGSESEPASRKDRLLLERVPHLVLDGAVATATAVGAREAIVCVSGDPARAAIQAALAERSDAVAVRTATIPHRYVAGEESAVVQHLGGGPAKPTLTPPRPFERGVRGRPTIVQNVETLAHVAQIARYGDGWFREAGSAADPGSALITISGAVAVPGVYEVECGTTLEAMVGLAGGPLEPLQAFLVGGYFGGWFDAVRAAKLELGHSSLRESGGSLGSGVIVALPASACGLREVARVLEYMAAESCGQCGPCVHGLGAIAASSAALADGWARREGRRLEGLAELVTGRGACHHPDGVARFVRSALAVFADDVEAHRKGGCGRRGPEILPVPAAATLAESA